MEKMPDKRAKLKVGGYSLVESLVAVVIITISLVLSTQLLNTPLLGSSHYTIVDIEHIADSVKSSVPSAAGRIVLHRQWGVCIVESTAHESFEVLKVVKISATTNAGLKIPVRTEVYEVAW